MAADTICGAAGAGIDAQGKADGFGTFVLRRIVGEAVEGGRRRPARQAA